MASIKNTITTASTFHSNQINAGNEIIEQFEKFNLCHLQAQMQSGKTGASLYTAFNLVQNNHLDTFHVLSGISDLDLKNQWIEKIKSHFDSHFESNLLDSKEQQYMLLLKKLFSMGVYFGKSIKDINELEFFRNSLIILDEVHYGSSNDSIISKLFKRLNISSILYGENCDLLDEYNIKILVVTATGANLDSVYNNTDANKNWGRVYMEPGPNYKGVLDYYNSHNILSNFNITSDNIDPLVNVLNKYKSQKKYIIFRAVTQKAHIISEVCNALNIPCISYNQESTIKFDDIQPKQFTCVLIKNKLRVGKELNKQHICAVFESSLIINTDTLLQGLFGRICGYNISNNIDVYIVTKYIDDIMEEFTLINKTIPEAAMTRTKFVKKYVTDACSFPEIKEGSMHTPIDI